MKDDFAKDITNYITDNWKKFLFISLICALGLGLIKGLQSTKPSEPRKIEQTNTSLDSLSDFIFNILFKPAAPETLGMEFFIFKDAQDYNHLDIIAREYPKAKNYIPIIQKAIKDNKNIFSLDAILILGKIETESWFKKFAVSRCGAAGTSQLMPKTV